MIDVRKVLTDFRTRAEAIKDSPSSMCSPPTGGSMIV